MYEWESNTAGWHFTKVLNHVPNIYLGSDLKLVACTKPVLTI